jgi:hypothetical protein
MREKGQGGAPDRGKEIGRGMERRRSPTVPELAGDTCRVAEIWREISQSSLRLERRSEKERGKGSLGYL